MTEDQGAMTEDRGAITEDQDGETEDFYCHIFVQNGIPYLTDYFSTQFSYLSLIMT